VFDNMPANYFIKFVIGEWIGEISQIVDYIRMTSGIGVDAYRARSLVLPTANVENLFAFDVCRKAFTSGFTHRSSNSVLLVYELNESVHVQWVNRLPEVVFNAFDS